MLFRTYASLSNEISLVSYSDVDWGGDVFDRKPILVIIYSLMAIQLSGAQRSNMLFLNLVEKQSFEVSNLYVRLYGSSFFFKKWA